MSHEAAHHGSADRLVMMANQISRAFAHGGEEKAAADTANHLRRFWDPRMRAAIVAYVQHGGDRLDPIARKAVQSLAHPPESP